MKKMIKLFSIITLAVIFGLGLVSCDGDGGGGDSMTVNAKADSDGKLRIDHAGGDVQQGLTMQNIQITTALPAPNNSFTLIFNSSEDKYKDITGLNPNQVVSVTAKTSARRINLPANIDGYIAFTISHWTGP